MAEQLPPCLGKEGQQNPDQFNDGERYVCKVPKLLLVGGVPTRGICGRAFSVVETDTGTAFEPEAFALPCVAASRKISGSSAVSVETVDPNEFL